MRLALPDALRAQILHEARQALPGECCGLLLGSRRDAGVQVQTLYPARNLAARTDRFELAPQDHFAAQRQARGAGQEIVGCYHSHPAGEAKPSQTDAEGAAQDDFVWLIAAPGPDRWQLGAFVYRDGRLIGADLVTSSS